MAQLSKSAAYYNLRDVLDTGPANGSRTCPVCYLIAKSVTRYLDSLLYELVNDPGVRQEIRDARGFCNEHAWQLQKIGGALGIGIIYRDVIETVVEFIRQGKYRRNQLLSRQRLQGALSRDQPAAATADLVAILEPQGECPACRQQRVMEDVYLSTLLEHLDDEHLAPALRASAGLCLPHFRQTLQLVQDEQTFQRLVEVQLACLERLDGELSELVRKHDYRFAGEGFGAEGDSWIRAVAQVSGQEGIR